MEFAEAARLHADSHVARIFPIYGIKNFENRMRDFTNGKRGWSLAATS